MANKTSKDGKETIRLAEFDLDGVFKPISDIEKSTIVSLSNYLCDNDYIDRVYADEIERLNADYVNSKRGMSYEEAMKNRNKIANEIYKTFGDAIRNNSVIGTRHRVNLYVKEDLEDNLNNNIIRAKEIAGEKGYYTVLLSLNFESLLETLTREDYLDMDDFSGMDYRKKLVNTEEGEIREYKKERVRDLTKGRKKGILHDMMEIKLSKEYNIDWDNSFLVEDRITPALEDVGNPILLHPGEETRKRAEERGYSIVESPEELIEFIDNLTIHLNDEEESENIVTV